MNGRQDYHVRFLASDGSLMEDVILTAKSIAIAVDSAGAVGIEIGAAIFYISPKPGDRNLGPSAMARRKPCGYRQPDPEPAAGLIHQ